MALVVVSVIALIMLICVGEQIHNIHEELNHCRKMYHTMVDVVSDLSRYQDLLYKEIKHNSVIVINEK